MQYDCNRILYHNINGMQSTFQSYSLFTSQTIEWKTIIQSTIVNKNTTKY